MTRSTHAIDHGLEVAIGRLLYGNPAAKVKTFLRLSGDPASLARSADEVLDVLWTLRPIPRSQLGWAREYVISELAEFSAAASLITSNEVSALKRKAVAIAHGLRVGVL